MQILVDVAGDIDHRQASSLFLPALPRIAKRLSAEEFYRWRYNRGFGNKTKQVALHAGNEIIGQAIVFSQIMVFGHRILRVAQLGDLIVKNEYRSPAAVYAIYNGIKQELHSGEYDLAFTLPNERSVVFNQRFLGLQPSKPLPSRMSLGVPCRSGTVGFCKLFSSNDDFWNGAGRELISPITGGRDVQVWWDQETISDRLSDPRHQFGVISTHQSTMITSPRTISGVPCVLIMGVLCTGDHKVSRKEWYAMVNASTRLFGNPLHLYVGYNDRLDGDFGFKLPNCIRSSSRTVQISILSKKITFDNFTRLELIDLDIY